MIETQDLINTLHNLAQKISGRINIMEVCGTHTVVIHKSGLKNLLPVNINLVSGPGCPVCVTDRSFIDKAITYLREGYHIFTFGDMLKVPGSFSSLEKERGFGVHIVYSPLESLKFAWDNPRERVLFLGIGFETTSPLIASLAKEAYQKGIDNLFILSSCKLIPPALRVILEDENSPIQGFILPGHVSAVIGCKAYREVLSKYGSCGVVCGFEPNDVLESLVLLMEMLIKGEKQVLNQYRRVVKEQGNTYAQNMIGEVFEKTKAFWRGLGWIEESGLKLNSLYRRFDIEEIHPLDIPPQEDKGPCRCAEVIKGKLTPLDCPLFAKECNPSQPWGPCMVSSEGTCQAYYKYGR